MGEVSAGLFQGALVSGYCSLYLVTLRLERRHGADFHEERLAAGVRIRQNLSGVFAT